MHMPIYAVVLLIGICTNQWLSCLFGTTALLIILSISLVVLLLSQGQKRFLAVIKIMAVLLIGFCWRGLYINQLLQWQLPKTWENKTLLATGIIHTIPEVQKGYASFQLKLEQLTDGQAAQVKPALIQLSWYGECPKLSAGRRWQLAVRLKQPHGYRNPGGVNREASLLQKHVRAVGYVKDDASNKLLAGNQYPFSINQVRQHLLEKIQSLLTDNHYLGFIEALTLGVTHHISSEQWQWLRATGTSHLMAISGLHIGLVAGFVFASINFAWRRHKTLALAVPAQQAAAAFSLLVGLIYSLLAGFSIPTQRALIMLAVFLGLLLSKRQTNKWQALSLALVVVLLGDPLAPYSAGFWLSFGAVAYILYGTAGRHRPSGVWWRYGRVQWIVTLGLLPLSLLLFQQASLSALAANLVAIPWISFTVVPVALLGVIFIDSWPWLAGWLLKIAALSLSVVFKYLAWLAGIKFLLWQQAITQSWILAAAIIGTLVLLAPFGFPARWLGTVFLLPIACCRIPGPTAGELWFSVLDVGQGLASVIRTQNHVLIYDTGPAFGPGFDAGSVIVTPYLRYSGVRKVDTLIVSHGDSDHSGGATSILQQITVNNIYTSVPERFKNHNAVACEAGQHWQWDNVYFEFLSPPNDPSLKDNNRSCVLRVTAGSRHILLPGDIEKLAEHFLLTHKADKLPATIIVAPHHGSTTSSTQAFVNAVQPDYVIFSTGYLNRFKFPKPMIVARYQDIGAHIIETVNCGMVQLKIASNGSLTFNSYSKDGSCNTAKNQ